ncbi:MAG: succinate dehydrogenase assembly factor 2 [Gammaproteobacteria bacterium]|nr:succinate dehydrogenase assembly factor 2 [Gammaproteobacteria bacterium]MDH4252907.1 succinate dehydrogenase assembly factor 2 [Gammaproteobacteria bacterium]MDH5308407.1 succinate dehydrogenase assembly factor 2 [Gammaproteobacteria bacterium]
MEPHDRDVRDARLRWQCRRGMRELDELLLRYFECIYPASDEDEKSAFRELLALSDPDLVVYLLGGASTGQPATDRVLGRIRR